MTRLILATRNAGKITELHAILADAGLPHDLVGADAYPDLPDVKETGVTFAANALLKAHALARATGHPAIADDSGLCVDILGGAPGILSARWSGTHGDDKANLVLSLLAKTEFGVPRTVARVNNPKNEWMFDESWGVDVAVSTPRLMTALIEEAVSIGDLVRIFEFQQGRASMVEITLPDGSPFAGQRVGDIIWPTDTVLVAIIRDERPIAPTRDDAMEVGDELLFITTAEQEPQLKQLVAPRSRLNDVGIDR